MKKNFWLLLSAAMAMFSVTSCSQDETATSTMEDVEAVTEVPVEVEGFNTTRGVLVEDGEEIEVWWAAKESIGVYGSRLTNAKFTSTNKYKNAATATFSGGSLFSSPKYAYYPYSDENSGNAQTAVRGTIPQEQSYSTTAKQLTGDYKIGTYKSRSWTGYNFTFSNVTAFAKFVVDATGTALENEDLQQITITATTADGQPRQLSGGFTMDLTQSANNALTWDAADEKSNTIALWCQGLVNLSKNSTYTGYASIAPTVKAGDAIKIQIKTTNRTATFTRTSVVDFAANLLVVYNIALSEIDDLVITDNEVDTGEEEEGEGPVMGDMKFISFKFTVANNPGKILARELYLDGTTTKYREVTEVVCRVDNENMKISLELPYLNNRKLIPTFEVPENCWGCTDGGIIYSGETEVDFSVHKQIGIINEAEEVSIYDIELTNTGLPVVVINQQSGLLKSVSADEGDYQKATQAWYDATGTLFQPKDSDWEMTEGVDNFMVYNADGTSALTASTEPVLASTRVRGNVTQQMPKKAFAVKLDKKSGVLNMPAHKRWVLLANWKDRTLMRNEVAFGLAKVFKQTFPTDGMAWNPSGQHVELVYNGVHVGNYYLCEQIKIDGGRLNINDPYDAKDAVGDPASYGYLLENDDEVENDNSGNLMSTGSGDCWFYTANYIPFIFKDDLDSDGNSSSTIRNYVQNFVRGVEDNLYAGSYDTAFDKMDLTSFVDFWLVQELMMNNEAAQPKSCYMNINNGVLSAGPLWDFDWNTLPASGYSEASYSYSASMLQHAKESGSWWKTYYCFHKKSGYPTATYDGDRNYIWYPMLVKSTEFKALAAQRWNAVKGALQAYAATIPTTAQKIAKSAEVNSGIWYLDSKSSSTHRGTLYGIGGTYSNSTPGVTRGYCGDEAMTFDAACTNLMNMLNNRINGMSYVSNQTWPSVAFSEK